MAEDDKKKIIPLRKTDQEDEGSSGKSGSGGQTGAVEFRFKDAMSVAGRDDTRPPSEIRRLQVVHKDIHKERVKKAMHTRKDRASRKDGNPAIRQPAQYQVGYGGGGAISKYKKHPVSDKMRGMADPQVIGIPGLQDASTNSELKDRLENKLQNQLQNRYQNVPKFNPRPRPV